MTEKMNWLAERWVERLGPAISAMTGEKASAGLLPGLPVSQAGAAAIRGFLDFDLAEGARAAVVVSEGVWNSVGRAVLAAAGIEDVQNEELEGTFLEVLQQSLSPLAQALSVQAGREVTAGNWQKLEDSHAFPVWVGVLVQLKGEGIGEAWISASEALLNALALRQDSPRPDSRGAAAGPAPEVAAGRNSKTLDLLLEVELPVGVSFGRTQMRLKDAIKLSTGSIVELNRTITEPVEIIVNNCVIARGEVVVVEGNYGVRIKEIVSREERLRTLF